MSKSLIPEVLCVGNDHTLFDEALRKAKAQNLAQSHDQELKKFVAIDTDQAPEIPKSFTDRMDLVPISNTEYPTPDPTDESISDKFHHSGKRYHTPLVHRIDKIMKTTARKRNKLAKKSRRRNRG